LASYNEGGTQAEGVEEDIWDYEGGGKRRVEKSLKGAS
jgi:hypothetical protein